MPNREDCDFNSEGTRIDGKAGKLTETDPVGMTRISGGFTAGVALSLSLVGTVAAGCSRSGVGLGVDTTGWSSCLVELSGMREDVAGAGNFGISVADGSGRVAVTCSGNLLLSATRSPAFGAEFADGCCDRLAEGSEMRPAPMGVAALRFAFAG